MKLLVQAALRNRKHLALLALSYVTLILLTCANALEISALGVILNGDVLSSLTTEAPLSLSLSHKETNPLQWVLFRVQEYLIGFSGLKLLVTILVGVALLKAVTLFFSRYMTQILSIRVSRDLRGQYFEHIQSLPMSFYQKHNIGALSSRVVGDAGQIAVSMNSAITNFLHTPFTLALSLSFCCYISWKLSALIFIGLPIIIVPIVFLSRRVKKVSRQLQINQEKFTSVLIDFLAGVQTAKIFAMEAFSLKKYSEQNSRMAVLEAKTAKYGLLTRPILHAITTVCLASAVLMGLYGLGLSISELILFCGLLQMSYESIKKFAEENANIQRGIVAAERMFEVLHLTPEIEDSPSAIPLTTFSHSIEFDQVWFRYQGDWILKNVSFSIRKGETVALVGPTGSGKSTLVLLLPRLFDVQQGEIRIDGKPLSSYTQKSIRELLGFVSQKPFLFSDTIGSNIAFGRDYSQREIELAAKKAHAHEFIKEQPFGYETMLAEMGQNLSGGQQQRVAIARALVKKAPILILDEATSSLDALSEQKIKEAIKELHGEVTQIIIAHRLATIEHADRIIYLEKGEKIAEGTKEELLATCTPFREVWETFYSLGKREPIVESLEPIEAKLIQKIDEHLVTQEV